MTTFNCLRCNRPVTVRDIRKSDGLCTTCDGTDSMMPPALPEAAEPLAKIRRYKTAEGHEHWEFVGERYPFFDLPHGEHSLYAAPSPVAQAPAQAGEVANDFAAGWNINLCDTKPFEVASSTLADHSIVRAALATPPAQPVLAPVVREPLTEADVLRIADESDVSRGYEIETTFATAIQRACAEAWGIALTEAAGGIQATTGEPS